MKKQKELSGNAVIYARFSSHAQREVSIEQQVAACRSHAEKLGLTVISVYSDKAMSGTTDNRPQFQKMLRESRSGAFDFVIAWKSNRMGRNMLQSMMNEQKLAEQGVRCLYVEEDFDDTAAGRFALRNMMNVNQFYSENMAEDIRRGLADNAAKCKVNCPTPFGYRKGPDGRFEIDEEKAGIVREIFARTLAGWKFKDIAEDLNRRGLRTARGNEWNKGSFHRMLNSEVYTGVYLYADTRIENGVPVIIPRSEWDACQRLLTSKSRPQGRRNAASEYILTGKLFCGLCGALMVGTSGTGKSGKVRHYYKCKSRMADHSCDKSAVRREWLEEIIVNVLRELVLVDSTIDWIVEGTEAMIAEVNAESGLSALKAELKEAETSRRNIVKAIEQGLLSQTLIDRLTALDEQVAELQEAISLQEAAGEQLTPDHVRFYLEDLRSGDLTDREYLKSLIRTFIERIELYEDRLRIFFTFSPDGLSLDFSSFSPNPSGFAQSPLSSTIRHPYEPRLFVFVGGFGMDIRIAEKTG